ncbi:ATP-dependent DNA helicase PIF6-like [Olea europaea var. sylvestris]|uniref:ATP-dependent DNA helicase PIF6-like n=1 Tax=Olea europaea var. sylvestris TaxID=158386 RepID=UPI000C1D0C92|nr:ATP-dependent DNA helicase PIF6-like [Olea europaea var. sylvestris]
MALYKHLPLIENMRAKLDPTFCSYLLRIRDGTEREHNSIDKSEQNLQEDFLNSLTPNGIPPHELMLKINCLVMLLWNINNSEGLCNVTRLTCRKFEKNVILAEITTGEYCGKYVFLPRIPFIRLKSDHNSIQFKRTQFPIRPCFAMTINKALGQTLDFIGLYLPQPVFCHGQLYVALSRTKTSKSIKVLLKPINSDIYMIDVQ